MDTFVKTICSVVPNEFTRIYVVNGVISADNVTQCLKLFAPAFDLSFCKYAAILYVDH